MIAGILIGAGILAGSLILAGVRGRRAPRPVRVRADDRRPPRR
jgi:hypothetical protein